MCYRADIQQLHTSHLSLWIVWTAGIVQNTDTVFENTFEEVGPYTRWNVPENKKIATNHCDGHKINAEWWTKLNEHKG